MLISLSSYFRVMLAASWLRPVYCVNILYAEAGKVLCICYTCSILLIPLVQTSFMHYVCVPALTSMAGSTAVKICSPILSFEPIVVGLAAGLTNYVVLWMCTASGRESPKFNPGPNLASIVNISSQSARSVQACMRDGTLFCMEPDYGRLKVFCSAC